MKIKYLQMAYNVIISELHVPEMFFGESLLLYTDVDYNWLDSGYCGDQFYCLCWDILRVCVVCVCVWGGVGVARERSRPTGCHCLMI